jgi:hypothetical protein
MSFFVVWSVFLYLTTSALGQAGPFSNDSGNGTYKNPILNLQGAADPLVFPESPTTREKAEFHADG